MPSDIKIVIDKLDPKAKGSQEKVLKQFSGWDETPTAFEMNTVEGWRNVAGRQQKKDVRVSPRVSQR